MCERDEHSLKIWPADLDAENGRKQTAKSNEVGWLIKADSLPAGEDRFLRTRADAEFPFPPGKVTKTTEERNKTSKIRAGPGEVGVVDLLLAVLPPLVAVVVRREGVHLPHPLLLPDKKGKRNQAPPSKLSRAQVRRTQAKPSRSYLRTSD